jgi:hypothetical protein
LYEPWKFGNRPKHYYNTELYVKYVTHYYAEEYSPLKIVIDIIIMLNNNAKIKNKFNNTILENIVFGAIGIKVAYPVLD